MSLRKNEIWNDRIERIKWVQEIDLKKFERIIFLKTELQIIELIILYMELINNLVILISLINVKKLLRIKI